MLFSVIFTTTLCDRVVNAISQTRKVGLAEEFARILNVPELVFPLWPVWLPSPCSQTVLPESVSLSVLTAYLHGSHLETCDMQTSSQQALWTGTGHLHCNSLPR